MPIATRARVQGQIPFKSRKTRSLDTKGSAHATRAQSKSKSINKDCTENSPQKLCQSDSLSDSGRDVKMRGRQGRQTRSRNTVIESPSGEWVMSPKKRQLVKESNKEKTPVKSECSPRKIKKENVPVASATVTEQCPSPRKNRQVDFANGCVLKDVQNSPRKELRESYIVDAIVEGALVNDQNNYKFATSDNCLVQKRHDLVLPLSPCKRVVGSAHRRSLSFSFQDEPKPSCSARSPYKTPKKENVPAGTLQDVILPVSPDNKLSMSRRKSVALGLQRQHGECYQKAKKALHTSVPDRLVCREKETKAISTFLQDHLGQKKPASMYISGAPGTGKTACLSSIMREKKDLMKSTQIVYINCMSVKQSQQIYNKVLNEVSRGHKAGKIKAKAVVAELEQEFTKSGPMVLLVMDEIDHLDSKNQEVLYTMFEWPTLRRSRLVLIGIANALDLTDRILPRLQARPKCKPKLLHFAPYTRDQILTILKDRLNEANEDGPPVIDPMAVQLCARKVAAVAGDIRKALDVCRRAVELVENDVRRQTVLKTPGSPRKSLQSSPSKSSVSPRKSPRKRLNMNSPSKSKSPTVRKVGLIQISNVISEVYGSCLTTRTSESQTFPLQQKLIICTVLLMVKKGKFKEVTLGKLHETYTKVCRARQMPPVDQSECVSLCELIETRGVLQIKKAKDTRNAKICLKLDEKELEFALQDKVLMSSILKDGLPSKKK